MKLVKPLVVICLILVAAAAGGYFYKNCQADKRSESMMKEDKENKRVLSETHKKTSEEMAKDIRNY
ncbi:MAG: hypothetical protein R3F23_03325 [Verrucomicrobiia bacterium]